MFSSCRCCYFFILFVSERAKQQNKNSQVKLICLKIYDHVIREAYHDDNIYCVCVCVCILFYTYVYDNDIRNEMKVFLLGAKRLWKKKIYHKLRKLSNVRRKNIHIRLEALSIRRAKNINSLILLKWKQFFMGDNYYGWCQGKETF